MNVNKFVFVDESGLNREYRRLYARAKRGVKVYDKTKGKRCKRTNIIGGLVYGETAERHIAVQSYEHSTTSAFFEDWFEHELIPLLPPNALADRPKTQQKILKKFEIWYNASERKQEENQDKWVI